MPQSRLLLLLSMILPRFHPSRQHASRQPGHRSRTGFVRTAAASLLVGVWSLTLLTAQEPEQPGKPADKPLPPAATQTVDFETDIQPILAQSCHKCHGAEKQLGGLRLDLKADALRGGDSGKVLEPGRSSESMLIHHVAGTDPDVIMPPKGERLTPAQIGLLRAWIDQGARWSDTSTGDARVRSDHWSFQPVQRVTPPAVRNAAWVRNPIDAFVLAALEANGVAPSPEADRVTLIRRLSLDLLGLPPAPSDVEAFVNDAQPDAYEQLVERLLASSHFGERWGRHWLDLARYADSDGYEKDTPRPYAWRFRSWVIDAINRDLPFDQFTIEQLAGDLLPDATVEQKVATGFHRNTLTNKEGGVDQEEYRIAATVDRVNTLGAVWLGLTVGCAQCHTHKYDPLSQHEYYRLFAFFNSLNEVNAPAPNPDQLAEFQQAQRQYDAAHQPLLDALHAFEKNELPGRQAAWEQSLRSAGPAWTVLEPVAVRSTGGVTFEKQSDGSWLASGANPAADTYEIDVQTPLKGITGFRLEVLPDASLPASGPGRVAHGNFVLSEFKVAAAARMNAAPPDPGALAPVALQNPSVDYFQGAGKPGEFSIDATLDGKTTTGWAIAPRYAERHVAVFETAGDIGNEDGTFLRIVLDQQHGQQHTIGRFRLSATTGPRPVRLDLMSDEVRAALAVVPEQRTAQQNTLISKHYRTIDPDVARLQAAIDEHARQLPTMVEATAQMVAEGATPRPSHLLIRGDFLRKGAETPPGTPGVLHPFQAADDRLTRLDLARWLVEPSNPLTRRVTVNHWWQHLFGRGLVATVEDFGVRGEQPSHPELLDWLADELLAQKWSRKELLRRIVTSATYRQSSRARPDLVERDPRNIWLARQSRFRLEAEVVRDLYLAASGLLNEQVGGPSIRPPLPAGVAELGYAGSIKWPETAGADKYRRGLYIFYQRTVPYPMLSTFDAPDSNVACVQRERSNTPLQALTLLNDPVFVECAQGLGRRMMTAVPDSAAGRIRYAFQVCLARLPAAEEQARLEQLHEELLSLARANPEAAMKLAGPLTSMSVDASETAAAIAVARVLLNLDEFVVRE